MDPKLLRAMADMLENPEEMARKANQAKDRLFKLVAKFDQEKPHIDNEDMSTLGYGVAVALSSTLGVFAQMGGGLRIILQMAHWLGKKEGRGLGHKQARAEQLFQNVKDPSITHEEEK